MDNNLIRPTDSSSVPANPAVANIGVQPYTPSISLAAPPEPARIGFTATPQVPTASIAAAPPVALPVVQTPRPQGLPVAQELSSQLADVGVRPTAPGQARSKRFQNGLKVAAIFSALMLVTVGATYLFNKGQEPVANNQTNARGVVVPEQDLGSSVVLTEVAGELPEAQTLIVNGDIRLQGALNFNSGQYLASFVQGNLTADQTYTLPDDSGEVCLSSNNCNFLTGAQLVATGLITAEQLAQAQANLATASQLAQLQNQVNGIVVTSPDFNAGTGISIIGDVIQNSGVLTLNGQSGAVTLTGGSGILVSGTTISNGGVLTVQGQTGAVTFTAGSGIGVSGTTISNNGVLSLGGQTGALDLISGPGISISGLTVSNNGVTSTQGLTGNVVFTAGAGIDITGTAVSNTGVTLLTGTANQVSVSGGTGSVTLSLPQDIAVSSTPTFGGLTLTGPLTATSITSAAGLTVGATNRNLTLQGSAATTLSATNGANSTTLSFQSPTANVIYRFSTAAAGTYDVCTTTGNCTGVGGGVTTPGGTSGTIPKFTSSQGLGDSLITDNGTKITINGDFDVTGVINGQLVSPDAHFTGNVTVDLDLDVNGTLTVSTIDAAGALTVGNSGQSLLLQGSAVTLSNTSGGITNSLVFATPSGSNKTITLPNASGTVCLTSGNCAGVGGTGDVLQGGNSFGTAMAIGTNDNFALSLKTNGSTAMTILANGNVGINDTTPSFKLDVNGTINTTEIRVSDIGLYLWGSDAGGTNRVLSGAVNIESQDAQGIEIGTAGAAPVVFYTGTTEKMRILSGGNVGIGTNNPDGKLHVNGGRLVVSGAGGGSETGQIRIDSGAGASWYVQVQETGGHMYIAEGVNRRLFLETGGNVGIGNTDPEAKLHVSGGNLLLENTYSYQIKNNASTAISLLGMDSSNHLTLGATSGMGDSRINAGTGNMIFATSGGTAMTILNGGNVGLGTTNSGAKFTIRHNSSTTDAIRFENSATNGRSYLLGPGTGGATSTFGLYDATATTMRLSMDANGLFSFGTPATVPSSSKLVVPTGGASNFGIVVQGAASQSGDLLQLQSSTGTVVAKIAANGRISTTEIGPSSGTGIDSFAALRILNPADVVGFQVRAFAGQNSDLMQWQASNGTVLGKFTASGSLDIGNDFFAQNHQARDSTGSYLTFPGSSAPITVLTRAAANVGLVVKGSSSQSGNLQEWQSSTGTVLARVNASGHIFSPLVQIGDSTTSEGNLILDAPAGGGGPYINFQKGGAAKWLIYQSSGSPLYIRDAVNARMQITMTPGTAGTSTTQIVDALRIYAGSSGQTANLQEWQNSSQAILSKVDATGGFTIGLSNDTTTTTAISITSPNAADTSSGNGRAIRWYGNSTSFDSVSLRPVAQTNVGSAGLQIFTARSNGGSPARYSYFAQRDDATNGYPTVFSGLTLNSTATNGASANGVLTVFATTLQNDGTTAVSNPGTTIYTDGNLTVALAKPANIGMVIKGAASQSANLQEWQNSAGTVLAKVTSSGGAAFGIDDSGWVDIGGNAGGKLNVVGTSNGRVLVVRGFSTQTLNLQEWQDSSGTALVYVDSAGNINWPSGNAAKITGGSGILNIRVAGVDVFQGGNGTEIAANGVPRLPRGVVINSLGAGWPAAIIKGAASQTADLLQLTNSSNAVLGSVDSVGRFYGREFYAGNTAGATVGFLRVGGTESWRWYSPDDPNLYLRDMVNGRMLLTAVPSATNPVIQVSGRQEINLQNSSSIGLTIKGAASQSADLQQWQLSNGTAATWITADGSIRSTSNSYGFHYNDGGSTTARLGIKADTAATIVEIIQGTASQTADLTQWRDNGGSVLATMTASGSLGLGSSAPTAKLHVVGSYTAPGTSWTLRTAAEANQWQAVTYGNGQFVAVAQTGTNRVMTSPDGITWTARAAAQANSWKGVAYGNSTYVAVAADGTNRVMTSPDGITWTVRTASVTAAWNGIAYGNGVFVAVASGQVMTSPDGITWTTRTPAEANLWTGVTYGGSQFVAVGYTGTNRVMTSPDGITWTARAAAAANGWLSVTYGNGLYVAVAENGTDRVMTSPDGITWTSRNVSAVRWFSVAYGDGMFAAISASGTSQLMSSSDGINWTAYNVGTTNQNWWAITHGNSRFVGVSYDGTSQAITSIGVEGSAALVKGGTVLQSNINSTTAMQVQNSSGTTLVTADTTNMRVGIGTSTPGLTLEVKGSAGLPAVSGTSQTGILRLSQTGGVGVLDIGNDGSNGSWLQSTRSNSLSTYDPLLLNPRGGNVGIGTTSPGATLTLGGSGSGKTYEQFFDGAAGTTVWTIKRASDSSIMGQYIPTATSGGGWRFFTQASEIVQMGGGGGAGLTISGVNAIRFNAYGAGTLVTDSSGNITASSDERLKDVQGNFNRGLDDLLNIDPILYKWNGLSGLETNGTYAGFSAQNIQVAIPEAVSTDSRGYLTLQDRPLLAASVNAIKQLNTTDNALEARVVALETAIGANPTFASLNVTGHSTMSSLTVSGNVSVGGTLTVANAVVTGSLTIAGQFYSEGIAPAVLGSVAAGDGATVTVEGTDAAGTITIQTQNGDTLTDGEVAVLTFTSALRLAPKVQLTPVNENSMNVKYYVTRDKTGFKLVVGEPLEPGKTYTFDYFVIGAESH